MINSDEPNRRFELNDRLLRSPSGAVGFASSMCRPAIRVCLLLLSTVSALAQQSISVTPPEFYSGMNTFTFTAHYGLSKIQWELDGSWQDILAGTRSDGLRVITGPVFTECAHQATVRILVDDLSIAQPLRFRVIDCNDNVRYAEVRTSSPWRVWREDMGTVEVGETVCHTFEVRTGAGSFVILRIASPSREFGIRFTNPAPPVRVFGTYTYDVCFTGRRPGLVRMPILVYLRRPYPSGGVTSFIVADTAYVMVRPPERGAEREPELARGPIEPPSIPQLREDTPRVVLPPPMRDVKLAEGREMPVSVTRPAARLREQPTPPAPAPLEVPITDPTTFRTIAMPTARSPEKGEFFAGNVLLGGWMVGYGLTDRLSLLGAAAYVPPAIDYLADVSAGVKYEVYREGITRVAVGLQLNASESDESRIVLAAPYAVASLGDDDHRASMLIGYSGRRHFTFDHTQFNRSAFIAGVGGDYRIAYHWKLAAEGYLLQDSDYQPIVLTARYFDRTFAIDAGLGINPSLIGEGSGVGVFPVVTAIVVW